MTIFKPPQYTKVTNPKTGTQDPSYTFNIEMDDSLSFIANDADDLSLKSVEKYVLDNIPWWNSFIRAFLESSSKFFSKTYTVETIHKITRHTLTGISDNIYPTNVILIPKNIQICAGIFTIHWGYTIEPIIIPDFDNLPDYEIQGMEELNIDELPVETSTDVLELDNPNKFYDKQRVKETRLKAKLAHYKAERQMVEYCEKYGDDLSNSDDYTTEED